MKNLILLLSLLPILLHSQNAKLDSIVFQYENIKHKDNISEVSQLQYQQKEVIEYLQKFGKTDIPEVRELILSKVKEADFEINIKSLAKLPPPELAERIEMIKKYYDLKIKAEMSIILAWNLQKEMHLKIKNLSFDQQEKINNEISAIGQEIGFSLLVDSNDLSLALKYFDMNDYEFNLLNTKEKYKLMISVYYLDRL